MADTVIKKNDSTTNGKVTVVDSLTLQMASGIKLADSDGNNKISANELSTFLYDQLPKEFQSELRQRCSTGNITDISTYLEDIKKASRLAVDMGFVEEVVVPDVPKLCAAASRVLS